MELCEKYLCFAIPAALFMVGEVSMDLLLTTEKSVAEISEMVGYSSPANFSTFIKNVTGKTPSAIRREREKYIYNPE